MTTKFAGDRAGSQLVIEKSIWALGETPLKGRRDSINALFATMSVSTAWTDFPNRLFFVGVQ